MEKMNEEGRVFMTADLIVLLTDFGESDPYVGIMKGVISRIAPHLRTIDLSHQISPGEIQGGAFHLWQATLNFPPGSVFPAVVDPGVGSNRRGLIIHCGNQIFIGPDNGLFSYLSYKSTTTAWELTNPDYQLPDPSNTFHSRDIFASAAAYAALGTDGELFGKVIHSLVQLPRPLFKINHDNIEGEVISIDRFGNLITSLGQFDQKPEKLVLNSWIEELSLDLPLDPILYLAVNERSLPLVSTYNDISAGSCAGLIGSSGMLEIAARQSSAADLLELSRGDHIRPSWK